MDEQCSTCGADDVPLLMIYVKAIDAPIAFCHECVLISLEIATGWKWRVQYDNWTAQKQLGAQLNARKRAMRKTTVKDGIYVPEKTEPGNRTVA